MGQHSPYKWPFTPWLVNRGDPNHLLTGMILQVRNHLHWKWDFHHISYSFRLYIGDEILPSYMGILVSHLIRIPISLRAPRRPPRNLLTNTTPGILHFNGPSHEAHWNGFCMDLCGISLMFFLELI